MFKTIKARLCQGGRTIAFPKRAPTLPDRFRGLPEINSLKCPRECHDCINVCPTNAIVRNDTGTHIDMGRCLFCIECSRVCPHGALRFSRAHALATHQRAALVTNGSDVHLAARLDEVRRRLFGRSLKLRQVSAGGCNGCELDTNVLTTVVFDIGRFGIQFVASPRHADGLLVTGPVTEAMRVALLKTYEAVASPKIVIATGACAISGGPYVDHDEAHNGVDKLIPVDLYIPGCPPHPLTILDGLLRMLGRIDDKK